MSNRPKPLLVDQHDASKQTATLHPFPASAASMLTPLAAARLVLTSCIPFFSSSVVFKSSFLLLSQPKGTRLVTESYGRLKTFSLGAQQDGRGF